MSISHKKFAEIKTFVQSLPLDESKTQEAIAVLATILNYDENKKTYNKEYYERNKERMKEAGTWAAYQRSYYQQHKEELNHKRLENYHKNKHVIQSETI